MNDQNNNVLSGMGQPNVVPEINVNSMPVGTNNTMNANSGNIGVVNENVGSNLNNSTNLSFDLPSAGNQSINDAMNNNQMNSVDSGIANASVGYAVGTTVGLDGNSNSVDASMGTINSTTSNIPESSVVVNQQTTTTSSGDNNDNLVPVVSVKKFLGYMILFAIPVVGFIMLIVKALDGKKDKIISNYAKAQLVLLVITTILSIVLIVVAIFSIGSSIGDVSTYIKDEPIYDYDDYNDYDEDDTDYYAEDNVDYYVDQDYDTQYAIG